MTALGNPLVAAVAVVLALLGLLAGLRLLRQRVTLHPELARKLSHLGFGLITLTFPWLFHSAGPVIVVSCDRDRVAAGAPVRSFASRHRGGGRSWRGSFVARRPVLPDRVAGLFLLADGNWVLYTLPLLTLTLADATAALIGVSYGRLQYDGAEGGKSIEGSLAFFLVAFLAIPISTPAIHDDRARGVAADRAHLRGARHAAGGGRLEGPRQPVHSVRRIPAVARLSRARRTGAARSVDHHGRDAARRARAAPASYPDRLGGARGRAGRLRRLVRGRMAVGRAADRAHGALHHRLAPQPTGAQSIRTTWSRCSP